MKIFVRNELRYVSERKVRKQIFLDPEKKNNFF